MFSKISITLGVIVYGLIVPYLEVNASHVFNPYWPPHARLHEVWQLTTNCSIALIVLWLTWIKQYIHIASLLNIAVMGGVLVAHFFQGTYGGSLNSGNVERTIFGMELAAFIAGIVVILSIVPLIYSMTSEKH